MLERHVLIVDDDPAVREVVRPLLGSHGYVTETAGTGAEALVRLRAGFHGVVVLDMRLPDMTGSDVFKGVQATTPDCPVIFLTSYGSAELALETIQDGAFQFIDKDHLFDRLVRTVDNAFGLLAADPVRSPSGGGPPLAFSSIVTRAREMGTVFRSLRNAIDSAVPVLIGGESGTGKELVARAIHNHGPRRAEPFVAINCAGIPEQLLEAELFGFERGAFTGAVSRKIGKFEVARGGTLMLDEIGEMHLSLQAKLLRVLQEGEFQRLGGNETIRTEVRIVAATNRDLEEEVEAGRFRADLFYRIAVYTIHLPPLRQRTGDIPLLVDYFVRRFAGREGKTVLGVDPTVLELLELHDYPGNVRELENILSYAVVSSQESLLTVADLPPGFLRAVSRGRRRSHRAAGPAAPAEAAAPPSQGRPDDREWTDPTVFPPLREVERRHIAAAMALCHGNKSACANLLGVSRMRLYRKLEEYGIQ